MIPRLLMPTAELASNEELAKTQGQFESENQNDAEQENLGETNEALESAEGLEEMGESANQNISNALESARIYVDNGIDVISRNEGAISEDIGEAAAMGENVLAQNEQDAQEARQEIKSAVDLAKESSGGQMTELEKKWAKESAKFDQTISEQKDDTAELPLSERIKSSTEIAKESSKGNISALEQKWAKEQAQNSAETPQEVKVESTPTEAPLDESKQKKDSTETADVSDKESAANEAREKITQEAMEQAKDAFEKIPDNEKLGLLKGLAGLGFKTQEWKGKIFKSIFSEMAKKASEWTEKGEQSFAARICSSYSDIYKGVEDQAKTKQDKLYSQKSGALNTVAGIGALAGNALLYGRIAADVTQANPMRGVTATAMIIGRGGEAMKEAHLKSHEVINQGRVQDENEAYEEAMALYGQAKEKSPEGKVSAEDLRKTYKENLPKGLLNRIDKDQNKDGICSRIAQKIAKTDIEFSLKRIDKQIKNIESDDNLSPGDKAAAKNKALKKYEKFLHDMDRLVSNSGKIDLIAYGSRVAEKGGKAAASFMMLETLAEGIARGETALAALSAEEGDSSLELPFQDGSVELDQPDVSFEDQIIEDSAPDEISAEADIPENIAPPSPVENTPIESSPENVAEASVTPQAEVSDDDAVLKDAGEGKEISDDKAVANEHSSESYSYGKESDVKNPDVAVEEQAASEDIDIEPQIEKSAESDKLTLDSENTTEAHQEEAVDESTESENNKHTEEYVKEKNAEFARQMDEYLKERDAELARQMHEEGVLSDNQYAKYEVNAPQTESGSDQASQIDAGEEEIISGDKVVANEHSSESYSYGKESDVKNYDTVASDDKIESNDAGHAVEHKGLPSVDKVFGRRFINMENLQKIASEKGMSEQMLRNEATDAGSEVNRYVEIYKSLINAEGKSEKTDGILKKIADTTARYESKYGSGFLDKASILENLKK